jgi:insertion element IS1 protein InsB
MSLKVNSKSKVMARQVEVSCNPKKRLTVQMDELWSFVDEKSIKQSIYSEGNRRTH